MFHCDFVLLFLFKIGVVTERREMTMTRCAACGARAAASEASPEAEEGAGAEEEDEAEETPAVCKEMDTWQKKKLKLVIMLFSFSDVVILCSLLC